MAGAGAFEAVRAGSVISATRRPFQNNSWGRALEFGPNIKRGDTEGCGDHSFSPLGLLPNHQKTTKELLDERLTIQEGFFKGARITITEAIAAELMEDYAKQSCLKTNNKMKKHISYV